jgi:predicted MFS family arabinose efflux permease
VRNLLILVAAIATFDALFFAALAPMLPLYTGEVGLSKTDAGILTACYGAGVLSGALPGGLATRVSVKWTVVAGLALMSASSVVFGLSHAIWLLDVARFTQGVGGAVSWTGGLVWLFAAVPAGRRGEALGIVLGAAIGGSLIGPLLGAGAATLGVLPVFGAVALAGVILALVALRMPTPERGAPSTDRPLAVIAGAMRQRLVLTGLWITGLSAFAAGVISVLAPLTLAELGYGATAIGLAFLAAGLVSAVASPIAGRWADRVGPVGPIAWFLFGGLLAVLLVPWVKDPFLLAAVIAAGSVAFGTVLAPGMAMYWDGVASSGLDEGLGFGLMYVGWAPGQVIGAAIAGTLAALLDLAVPYLIVACACLVTLVGLRRAGARLRVEVAAARLPAPATGSPTPR